MFIYLRYNKTVIDCVAWNKYPKDDMFIYLRYNKTVIDCVAWNKYPEDDMFIYLRYNKTVIDCVVWNKYPKDDMLVCTGEMSGVVKLKNINMYGNYVQPFTTKSPPQTLTFCNSSPCLFVGCKSGVVYQYDYRASRYVFGVTLHFLDLTIFLHKFSPILSFNILDLIKDLSKT